MTKFKIEFQKEFNWYPYLSYVGNKFCSYTFIGVIFGYISIYKYVPDWMVESSETIGDKSYRVYKKNDKYSKEEVKMFIFPSFNKNK